MSLKTAMVRQNPTERGAIKSLKTQGFIWTMNLRVRITIRRGNRALGDPPRWRQRGASKNGRLDKMATSGQPKITAEQKRVNLREQIFPGCAGELWNRKQVNGFTTIPRTLNLIMTLIDQLTDRKKGHDLSRTYFELWCRAYDDYFIEVSDADAFAFAAGYVTRVRSWEERISVLAELGFVKVAPNGNKKQGYILLVDPHRVVKQLKADGKITAEWWGAYTKRASDIGYLLP